jgi:hypothetical protein
MFTSATVYMQQAEYDAAFGPDPAKFGFVVANCDKLRANPLVKHDGDHDVFGDGSVIILSTPGHTPDTSRCPCVCRRPASSCCQATPRISRRTSTTVASRPSISQGTERAVDGQAGAHRGDGTCSAVDQPRQRKAPA